MSFVTAHSVAQATDFGPEGIQKKWDAGSPFEFLDMRPGRVILIGAPPGVGKTTLSLQLVTNLLERQPELRCVIGNVETAPEVLVEKLLARYAEVPLNVLQDRTMTADELRQTGEAWKSRAGLLGRLAFMDAPYSTTHLKKTMTDFQAELVVLDYAQRFASGAPGDERQKLDALMSELRTLAGKGACVIAISSVSRGKSAVGYENISLSSFRGSAEFEFGADAAYILEVRPDQSAKLRCVKNRFAEQKDLPLRFEGQYQRFVAGQLLDSFDAAAKKPKNRPNVRTSERSVPGSLFASFDDAVPPPETPKKSRTARTPK